MANEIDLLIQLLDENGLSTALDIIDPSLKDRIVQHGENFIRELKRKEVTTEVCGGMLRVVTDVYGVVKSVTLDMSVTEDNKKLIEDMIAASYRLVGERLNEVEAELNEQFIAKAKDMVYSAQMEYLQRTNKGAN